ncbi:MAG TPA: TIGR01777 family oxidoreductase [Bdellovibrionota bacterium]|jgi:uncharacterized protein (TIGR01777 family)|nr:TIGR01777 family oxidoreductase [Bdellovibrionota bacterium]
MKVAIFGGTGFVGKHLQKALKNRNHESLVLDVRKDHNWKSQLKDCDAVINLAGAGLFAKRWDVDYKSLIHSSRVEGTHAIVNAMSVAREGGKGPQVLVNASAVGFYGASVEATFDESSESGTDFLAFVCREWEAEAQRAERQFGIRTAIVRFGVILGKDGGALKKLLPPFKAFLGGPIGFGKQFFPWVHIDDAVGLLIHALETSAMSGPFNAVAPEVITNKEFSKALGKALHRPSLLPVPGPALYVIVGEAADMLVEGQRVIPVKTLGSGYKFKFDKIDAALKNLLA